MNEKMNSNRNKDSIRCGCGNRVFFSKQDIITDENGNRFLFCVKCEKLVKLKRK